MKKSFFLLPLVVAFTLAGCNSTTSSEVETSDAVNTANTSGTWQPADIQPTAMPSSMNQPVSQPTYGASTTPSYNTSANSSYSNSTESVGNCQVIRDTSGTPVYTQMTKGCYTDSTYTVGAKDTLYLISFLSGTSPSQIASLNNMSTTTKLKVGQSLRVR
ncbi:LysM peptidoglycan-binding domain-containing protein [Actinobacillus minor]|uniref:Lipoprotein n=1 Tax=Actinobacillus minor NM305 TaxID=637911 RepID=C5RZW6_9PAST|nr:LysM domain-containing protein [Actinobacillus minor]EER47783.1 lipoprotein [Actinobacillus minor NM305]MDD6909783.1 LysM peptidoglycan-binding domain-containing protein [Actinobacillus minor]MDY5106624.1 LysM peptidoglycan-binding domain-containing protein [Actinobacillus minor]